MSKLALRPGSTSVASPRSLELHWGTSTQRVKFFPHGSLTDLLAGIRGLMGVAEDAPLRFRDIEGDIVLLAPAGIPDGTILHAAVEWGVPFQGTVAPAPTSTPATVKPTTAPVDPSWCRWARVSNVNLSEDGLGFEANKSATDWAAYTPVLPTSGQHYLVIDFPCTRHCCIAVGLIPAPLSSLYSRLPVWVAELPAMVALNSLGKGPVQADEADIARREQGPLIVGVYVDADARRVVFVPHDDPQNDERAIRIDDIPLPAVFAVYGPKHECKAVIRPGVGMPAQGVCTEPKALYVKQGRKTG